MADKSYKMTVGLSNGSSLNAGKFIAPQGASVLTVDTKYQSFQETIPRTDAYPNSVTLYGGELMVWASGECSRVTTNTLDTITSVKLDNMNLKGLQGEAGGSAYGGYNDVTSDNIIPLSVYVNLPSNPNCFCANFVSTNLNTFRLMNNNATVQSNLVYLQITRNPANLHWELYLGITSSLSGELGFVFGSVSGFNPDGIKLQSNEGNNTVRVYFQAFKT